MFAAGQIEVLRGRVALEKKKAASVMRLLGGLRGGYRNDRALGVLAGRSVCCSCLLQRPGHGRVVFPADLSADRRIQFASAHFPTLPYRVDQRMQLLARILEFRGWYAAEWLGAILRLVVAANEVATRIAAPKRQAAQIGAMRIDFTAIG